MINELGNKAKSFWERPEGLTGVIVLTLGAAGLWAAGPTLIGLFNTAITLVGQTITLVVLGTVLYGLWCVLSSSKFRTLCAYMFKSAMRWITGKFVEIDPIGIMRAYIEDLEKKRGEMGECREKLKGEVNKCARTIKDNATNAEAALKKAQVAKNDGNGGVFQVEANQAMRLEKQNKERLEPLLATMEIHLRALDKYREVTGVVVADMRNEVNAQELERNAIGASFTAMKAAKKILQGGTDERELFDQALEFTANDYQMKLGVIESFMEDSKSFVDGIDLQSGVYQADALKRIQDWESKMDNVLLGSSKQELAQQATSPAMHVSLPASDSSFDHLLKK